MSSKDNWIDQITGSFKDDPDFEEILRLGREARQAQDANPWLEAAGMFRDDPLFDDWQQAIAEYRRKSDTDADAP